MVKRTTLLLLALALLLAAVAGCSSGGSGSTEPGASGDTGSNTGPSDVGAPAALPLETDGEKWAASIAEGEEARKWASGDWQNGAPVSGAPLFVGYGVLVHDGATQYQVSVIDGEVVGFFGKSSETRYIEAQFLGYNPTIDPSSARQTEAFEAAKAEIASVNPNATQGGIELYIFFYPPVGEGQYPQACIYAEPTLAEYPMAIGGTYGWN